MIFSTICHQSYAVQSQEVLLISDASSGLPQETDSYSTVEVYDSDGDGLDEIYLGGSGFQDGTVLTEGIRAFEFNLDSGRWESFGNGLPGEGSEKYYGALGLGDVNGDGNMDISAPKPSRWYDIDYSENGVDIYSGDGNGVFSFLHTIPLDDSQLGSSNEVEIADLDDDGLMDMVVSTFSGIKVFFGDGSGNRWNEQSPPHLKSTEISGVGVGDLNGDGLLDLVGTPYQRSEDVEMYIQGTLRSWRDVPFEETSAGFGTKIIDVDLDGNDDVVYGTLDEGIRVWLGQGEVTMTGFPSTDGSQGLPTSDGHWDQVELSDINNDGKPDLVAAINSRPTIHCFINDLPTGWFEVFTGEDELYVGGDAYGANFGDWNGDGQMDIGACAWEDGADAWLIGYSGGTIPIADAGSDRTAEIGEKVTLDGSGSRDPDGEIVQWDWDCSSHDIDLDKEQTSSPVFTPLEEDIYVFNLRVMDDEDQWSQTSTVRITAIDPAKNIKPEADAGDPQHVYVGELVELDGSGSSDLDGSIEKWEWTCTSHNDLIFQDANTAYPSFTPDLEGTYRFRLTVTDDDGEASDPDTVSVEVVKKQFYPRLGPFKYENGVPVAGGELILKSGSMEKKSTTDESGYATFNTGIEEGVYSCSLELEGKLLLDQFTVTITDSGSVVYADGEVPVVPLSAGENNSFFIYLIIGIVVVVVAGFLVFMIFRRKGNEEYETVDVVQPVQVPVCQNCGDELSFLPDFNRYFCRNCDSYLNGENF